MRRPVAWWRARRGRLLRLWAVGLVSSVVVSAASAAGYLEGWQARALDLLLRVKAARETRFTHDVVIVAIDSRAFEGLERRQPLPREYLARIVRGLQRSGVVAVGLDVTLATPTTPGADAALAQALLDFADDGVSRVVVAAPLGAEPGPLSAAALGRAVVAGSARMPLDDDGYIRRVAPLVPGRDAAEPALALAVAARAAGLDPAELQRALTGSRLVPVPRTQPGDIVDASAARAVAVSPGDLWPINYAGPATTFLTIPSDVVAGLADPSVEIAADNPLRGRLALVGGTFEESRDFYQTPQGFMPGVEVHANVLHMLTTGRFIRPSGWVIGLAVDVGVVLMAGVVLLVLRPLPGTLACVAGTLALGVPASYLAFDRGGYWVDFLLPVLATCGMGLGIEALARRRLRDSFGRYLSRELLARVIDDAPSLRGERRDVSVLFSDLRGYTTLSETLAPEAIAAHLNEYFEAMTAAIFAHHGMINDFVGDAVMAVFGAPVADAQHAVHAVQSATAMSRALDDLNVRWAQRGLPVLRMGIGVHSGSVFAGNVGGHDRIKYTVIGDPVNVASRVEGLNKELGTTILITAETLAAVGERAQVKDHGAMRVKGRVEDVRVYEVLAMEPAAAGNGGAR